jgi:hypothetical protein
MFPVVKHQVLALCLFSICSVLVLRVRVAAQTPTPIPPSTAVVMVEIQCNPGTEYKWLEGFEKNEVPILRELVQKGDTYKSFTYFEAPLPAQEVDFILLFELKSFSDLDVRQMAPHQAGLLRRLGPEGFSAYMKEAGSYEKTVKVSILRSYKVQ